MLFRSPCISGLPLSTIIASGAPGYSCQLGQVTYTFYDDIIELDNGTSFIDFFNSPPMQRIGFQGLTSEDLFLFTYGMTAPHQTIESIIQTYTPFPMTPPPLVPPTGVSTNPDLPSVPDQGTIFVFSTFEPDPSRPQ